MVTRRSLTTKQEETLRLVRLGYTVLEIAKKKKKTPQSVYKILHCLNQKGWLNLTNFKRGVVNPQAPIIRLHGLMYQIGILYASPSFRKLRAVSCIIEFGDFKIHFFRKSLTLWIYRDFLGSTAKQSKRLAADYLDRTISFIEGKYNLTLQKKGYHNIKEVKSHYAKINDPLATKGVNSGQYVTLHDPFSKKEWLRMDKSTKTPELETTGPAAYLDMKDIIEPFYTLLKVDPFYFHKIITTIKTQSETIDNLISLSKNQGETAKTQTKNIYSCSLQVDTMAQNLNKLFSKVFKILPEPQKPPLSSQDQKKPPDYVG